MAVYKRGENYIVDFTFRGKRIRESIGPSRKIAQKVIDKRKGEIAENKYLDIRKDPEPINFYDFAKKYLQWAKANKKPSSFVRDRSMIVALNQEFEKKTMQEITTWQIEKYKAKRIGTIKRPNAVMGSRRESVRGGAERQVWYVQYDNHKGKRTEKKFETDQEARDFLQKSNSPLQKASVNRELNLLKHLYSKAMEWGDVQENPAKKVKFLGGEVKRIRYLMIEEVEQLLSNCADHLRPIVVVALHTGMRWGEMRNLSWERVNLDTGIISLLETKNDERRDIPINGTVRATLEGIERRGKFVFSNEDGKPYKRVDKAFRSALRLSAIRDFRFHDLRHTFASHLVMAGVDIMAVKELLGHKDLSMTLRYAHLAPNHKTRAVSILDSVYGNSAETTSSQNPPHAQTASNVISLNS